MIFQRAYNFWTEIPPPIREPIRSASVASAFGLSTAVSTAYTAYFFNAQIASPTWPGFLHLLVSPGFVGAASLAIAAAYRAHQASRRVSNTVTLPSGQQAVLTKGAPAP